MRRGPRASLVVTATIVGATVAPGFGAAQPRPQSPQDRPAPQPFGLFLANEGIILVGGQGAVVVFDALFRDGVEGYQTISREGPTLEDPWHFAGGVTLAVASHHHPDHFDAPAVLAHLRTNPGTRFVSTETAVDLLRALNPTESVMSRVTASWPVEGERDLLDFGTVRLETLNLHHGRGRSPTVQNLGHLVEAGGLRLLHMGDTEVTVSEIIEQGIGADDLDVAFLPYWLLLGASGAAIVEAIGAKRIFAVHIPVADVPSDWWGDEGSREGTIEALERIEGVTALSERGVRFDLPVGRSRP